MPSRSVHEKFEVDPSDPGVAGVVAHVPRPQPAGDPDQHSGGQVVELDPHHRAASASWRTTVVRMEGTMNNAILSSLSNFTWRTK